jgi:hypothetical protein
VRREEQYEGTAIIPTLIKDRVSNRTLQRSELGIASRKTAKAVLEQKDQVQGCLWGPGGAVIMLVISAFVGTLFVGMLLGLRFKVLVLVPFILIAACAIIIMDHELKVVALTVLATAMLQIGYLLGVVVRVWVGARLWGRKVSRHQQLSKSKPA